MFSADLPNTPTLSLSSSSKKTHTVACHVSLKQKSYTVIKRLSLQPHSAVIQLLLFLGIYSFIFSLPLCYTSSFFLNRDNYSLSQSLA